MRRWTGVGSRIWPVPLTSILGFIERPVPSAEIPSTRPDFWNSRRL